MNSVLRNLRKIDSYGQSSDYSLPFLTLKIVILPSLDILKREMHDTSCRKRLIVLFQKFINFMNNVLVSSKCINENQVKMRDMLFINEFF